MSTVATTTELLLFNAGHQNQCRLEFLGYRDGRGAGRVALVTRLLGVCFFSPFLTASCSHCYTCLKALPQCYSLPALSFCSPWFSCWPSGPFVSPPARVSAPCSGCNFSLQWENRYNGDALFNKGIRAKRRDGGAGGWRRWRGEQAPTPFRRQPLHTHSEVCGQ